MVTRRVKSYPRIAVTLGEPFPRVALVVGEPDVEARPVFLDEVVLEQQSLRLARHDDRLEVGDLAHQGGVLGGRAGVGTEVTRHPRPQTLRLADVEGLARGTLPQ